jgi:SAM-dependent methyltransferase
VCGEVIEHVVDTDGLVSEILRVLKPGGVMVLTTPNLAYALNRVILFMGLQPLFTETSLRVNMGRRWRTLGQGGPVQGHLKVFTIGALRELVAACGFVGVQIQGYRFFQAGVLGWLDRLFATKSSLGAGFVLVARKGTDA